METFVTKNITKIDKYKKKKKLNNTSTTEYKTEINIIEISKYNKNDGTQNRHEHH